jgi:hypothetical protein
MDVSIAIMKANHLFVDQIRAVDHAIAPCVYLDMRELGLRAPTSWCSAHRSGWARSLRCARA